MSNERIGGGVMLDATNEDPFLQGLEYLGGWENPAGSAAVASSAIVSFPKRDTIVILGRAVWGATADFLAMQVGTVPGAIDATAVYWDRQVMSRGNDTGATGATDGGAFFGSHTLSATKWPLQYTSNTLAPDNGTTQARSFLVTINNFPGMSKTAAWLMSRSTGAVASCGPIMSGWGEYVNTAAQIVSVRISAFGGTAQLAADTGFGVFGRNY